MREKLSFSSEGFPFWASFSFSSSCERNAITSFERIDHVACDGYERIYVFPAQIDYLFLLRPLSVEFSDHQNPMGFESEKSLSGFVMPPGLYDHEFRVLLFGSSFYWNYLARYFRIGRTHSTLRGTDFSYANVDNLQVNRLRSTGFVYVLTYLFRGWIWTSSHGVSVGADSDSQISKLVCFYKDYLVLFDNLSILMTKASQTRHEFGEISIFVFNWRRRKKILARAGLLSLLSALTIWYGSARCVNFSVFLFHGWSLTSFNGGLVGDGSSFQVWMMSRFFKEYPGTLNISSLLMTLFAQICYVFGKSGICMVKWRSRKMVLLMAVCVPVFFSVDEWILLCANLLRLLNCFRAGRLEFSVFFHPSFMAYFDVSLNRLFFRWPFPWLVYSTSTTFTIYVSFYLDHRFMPHLHGRYSSISFHGHSAGFSYAVQISQFIWASGFYLGNLESLCGERSPISVPCSFSSLYDRNASFAFESFGDFVHIVYALRAGIYDHIAYLAMFWLFLMTASLDYCHDICRLAPESTLRDT